MRVTLCSSIGEASGGGRGSKSGLRSAVEACSRSLAYLYMEVLVRTKDRRSRTSR